MISEAKLKAQYKYDKNNTQQIMLKLNLTSDADILKKLEDVENRQGYIKELVRKDIREKSKVLTTESIKYLVLPTAKRYEIKQIYLFGSYARGEADSKSDVDLLIDGGNYSGLIEYSEVIESFEKALGKKVDVVTETSLNGSKKSTKNFKKNIMKDAVKIYEK